MVITKLAVKGASGPPPSTLPAVMGTGACDAVLARGADKALGVFTLDAGTQLGGRVRWIDADMDGIAERLQSDAGYGGRVTLAPEPIAPLVQARFGAVRIDPK